MTLYYLDTCIWLNLFKKEKYFWKITKQLIHNIDMSNGTIIVSTIVLKELYFKLLGKHNLIKKYFFELDFIHTINTKNIDYIFARNLETETGLGFYDCLHVAVCKRINGILITRDKELLRIANNIIIAKKPEELIW